MEKFLNSPKVKTRAILTLGAVLLVGMEGSLYLVGQHADSRNKAHETSHFDNVRTLGSTVTQAVGVETPER